MAAQRHAPANPVTHSETPSLGGCGSRAASANFKEGAGVLGKRTYTKSFHVSNPLDNNHRKLRKLEPLRSRVRGRCEVYVAAPGRGIA